VTLHVFHRPQPLATVASEADVGDHQVILDALQQPHRMFHVLGTIDRVAKGSEIVTQADQNELLVIDDEDRGHLTCSPVGEHSMLRQLFRAAAGGFVLNSEQA
jgi:hypothetical protein